MNALITGQSHIKKDSSKTYRLVMSLCQDVCRAITNGEWKLPKHVLLTTTIRHIYRAKLLIIILNWLGHTESYTFALEMEADLDRAIAESF